MTGEKLQLRYLEDTNTIIQMWTRLPYIICLVYNNKGKFLEEIRSSAFLTAYLDNMTRKKDGTYRGDDKSTPNVNEAWEDE